MTAVSDVSSHAIARARWRPAEIAFWVLAVSCAFLFPSRYLIMTDILRLALFTLSLDLILGYAGIVSLGHAAFFGVGRSDSGHDDSGTPWLVRMRRLPPSVSPDLTI